MKKINIIILIFVILLSITALSQLNPITNVINKKNQITTSINLEQNETCTTIFYDEQQEIYNNCIYYDNHTTCLNLSGPDTDCSLSQDSIDTKCKEIITAVRNKTECKPDDKFIISIDKGTIVLKHQIDFSDWGPCIYKEENNCLIVTCVSLYDGAHKGQFIDCNGGKTCQKFELCDNSIKTFYKNSREDFVEEDPTFHLNKLTIKEVE